MTANGQFIDSAASAAGRHRFGAARLALLSALALALIAALLPASAVAMVLPDHRAYELVSRFEEGGKAASLNGMEPSFGAASRDGDTVSWLGLGGCCGAPSGAVNYYLANRGANGWQSAPLTPDPSEPVEGLFDQQQMDFWTSDLSETIFQTPASYAAGNHRPKGFNLEDLYLRTSTGELKWLSQGPSGTGTGPYSAKFDGATPDASDVVFGSAEPLTANATGLESTEPAPQYLYLRNVASETTSLLDVNDKGELLGQYGASLGDSGPPPIGGFSFGAFEGSSANAISEDGSKVFFETPPEGIYTLPVGVEPHLYMRDLANDTTTPIDDPSSEGSAQYEGASADGSLVFFTSDEGLDGASTANELYEFNTTSAPIGPAPPMTAVPVAAGTGVVGVVAISNDGSRVFFVSDEVLAGNSNSDDQSALANQPNMYVYDTASGATTFVATVAPTDVSNCRPTCASTALSGLVGEPDIYRPAVPTPNGSALAFVSYDDITGHDQTPATTLTESAETGEHKITVASTAGFLPEHIITIDTGGKEELQTVETIDNATEMTLAEFGPEGSYGLAGDHEEGTSVTELNAELYRYDEAGDTVTCISCTPPGVAPTGSASLGQTAGGLYGYDSHLSAMSEDGSRLFFQSPDSLVAGMPPPETKQPLETTNVYEWENGQVSLIAEGSAERAELNGTTPSGNDVYFTTRAALAAGAEGQDVYDARVNGGFPTPSEPPDPCAAESCRPLAAPTVFFPVPASATIDESGGVHGDADPSFAVEKITASQRRALERSGRLRLTVTTTAPGSLTLRAFARLHGKTERVSDTSATVAKATTVTLTLRLSGSLRAALAAGKRVTLKLEVGYSGSDQAQVAQLTLGRTPKGNATRKAGHNG